MSVAGIDIGDAGSCIALARKGGKKLIINATNHQLNIHPKRLTLIFPFHLASGVDVLLNKESNRETPSVVTFSAKQRMMGTSAGKPHHLISPNNKYPSIVLHLLIFPPPLIFNNFFSLSSFCSWCHDHQPREYHQSDQAHIG
jgi:hypothetical protein